MTFEIEVGSQSDTLESFQFRIRRSQKRFFHNFTSCKINTSKSYLCNFPNSKIEFSKKIFRIVVLRETRDMQKRMFYWINQIKPWFFIASFLQNWFLHFFRNSEPDALLKILIQNLTDHKVFYSKTDVLWGKRLKICYLVSLLIQTLKISTKFLLHNRVLQENKISTNFGNFV